MPSPFPGMDPYLEGHLWPDLHNSLAGVIREILAPQVNPAYMVLIEQYTITDTAPAEDVGILYPDIEILNSHLEEPAPAYRALEAPPITPATISILATGPIKLRIPIVEIREKKSKRLITVIEILSPVNKREPGLQPYREKRDRLHQAGVHLLEIDLIRRGRRPFVHPALPKAHYMATLLRAGVERTDVWACPLQNLLPVLPVPLQAPDPDVTLDLGRALHLCYERAYYHLAIDYQKEAPPPAFEEAELVWIRKCIAESTLPDGGSG